MRRGNRASGYGDEEATEIRSARSDEARSLATHARASGATAALEAAAARAPSAAAAAQDRVNEVRDRCAVSAEGEQQSRTVADGHERARDGAEDGRDAVADGLRR